MLNDNGRIIKIRNNYHITSDELKILLRYANECMSSKMQLLFALCAFKGLRVSEALAINIMDFEDSTFTKLTFREAKTNKMRHASPIIPPMAEMIKAYVSTNGHRLTDGYLFPYYTSKKKAHMTTPTAEAMFAKLRKRIGKEHPQFLQKYPMRTKAGKMIFRYRIGFHSLRRWFETSIFDNTKSLHTVKEIMRYTKFEPLNAYLNRYKVHENEAMILQKTFNPIFKKFLQ